MVLGILTTHVPVQEHEQSLQQAIQGGANFAAAAAAIGAELGSSVIGRASEAGDVLAAAAAMKAVTSAVTVPQEDKQTQIS